MDRKEEFLTKDILGNLSLRVAKELPCLSSLNDSTIWDNPIEFCKRIEENVREIDNVILEVRKDNGYFQNNSGNPLIFQVLLARVYILLYYRHTDEELYKAMVFPVLQENMGIYSEKLLIDIQSKVKKVQDIDRLIAQSQQEKKQNSKPKYALIPGGANQTTETFTKADVERILSESNEKYEKLKSDTSANYASLKEENEQLKKDKKQLENSLVRNKDISNEIDQKAANAYEKIIFFATVLSVAYDDRFTNQTSLANLICMVCGGSPTTYQPRISKLAKMADEGKYTDEVCNAAKNLIEKLKAIPKEDDKENPVVNKYIESISSEFGVK